MCHSPFPKKEYEWIEEDVFSCGGVSMLIPGVCLPMYSAL